MRHFWAPSSLHVTICVCYTYSVEWAPQNQQPELDSIGLCDVGAKAQSINLGLDICLTQTVSESPVRAAAIWLTITADEGTSDATRSSNDCRKGSRKKCPGVWTCITLFPSPSNSHRAMTRNCLKSTLTRVYYYIMCSDLDERLCYPRKRQSRLKISFSDVALVTGCILHRFDYFTHA